MQVELKNLKLVCDSVLLHLEKNGHHVIDIPYDYYWNMPEKSRYNVDVDPVVSEFDLGQLSDDIENMDAIAKGHSPPVGYALVWLSEIFKVIGEKIMD